tara:strand:- start:86 stop:223 length:138 start_codon:yes stop_codon:yes gene_type:complete
MQLELLVNLTAAVVVAAEEQMMEMQVVLAEQVAEVKEHLIQVHLM